ncbi:hypothetical protein BDW42DRAFT_182184 [Aspergillus taichungensis]|uniref:Uncharacterized protein n=1 Tax=Aspergillus taichungensis TaxID=482145 RepID=A0A2J5HCH9_9EURO|nr:hypothetical protein BDW42DRAFT_182184 [Aspergillus taichungensis]
MDNGVRLLPFDLVTSPFFYLSFSLPLLLFFPLSTLSLSTLLSCSSVPGLVGPFRLENYDQYTPLPPRSIHSLILHIP